MKYLHNNQSILISGESGAGKTVSTKFIMRYLTKLSSNNKELEYIEKIILESNPILEAFGNAATKRNNNSSRFGKFIKLFFNNSGKLVKGAINTYLLEKVRLLGIGDENNFHIFYQILSGLSFEQKEELFIKRTEEKDQSKFFNETKEAFKIMNFENNEINDIWKIISVIINLLDGNLQYVSSLLEVESKILTDALTTKTIQTVDETFIRQLDKIESCKVKDSLVMMIYSNLFNWIVKKINRNINIKIDEELNFIGILDIFGFEVFDLNGFEQLCINFANESLQNQFNQYIFKKEQERYEEENIKWEAIDYPDNTDCLKIISNKRDSIFSLLDAECLFPKGNDISFLNKIKKNLLGEYISISSKQLRDNKFQIKHYAGNVEYSIKDFCDKNKNTTNNQLLSLLHQSKIDLIQKIFGKQKLSVKSKIAKKSITNRFQNQLNSLLKVISKTNTHYIRCIKPNDKNIPDNYNKPKILSQLRYAGVLEAVKVARAGYPIRIKIDEFYSKYKILSNKQIETPDSILEEIITQDEYQVGLTRVFMKKDAFNKLETLWINKLKNSAIKIQSIFRMYINRKQLLKIKYFSIIIQKNIRKFIERKVYLQLRESIIKLQTYLRMYINNKKYNNFRNKVIKLQLFLKHKFKLNKMVLEHSVSLIQNFFRKFSMNKKNIEKSKQIKKQIKEEIPTVKIIDDLNNEVEKSEMEVRMEKMEQNFNVLLEKITNGINNEEIKKKDEKIETLNEKVKEQEKRIEEDNKVKMEMGERLQKLLITLNNYREENLRLRQVNNKKIGGLFSWW
tara:strand:- start:92 stop:2470 length:2379 start_codon:yes stop_codon:yes gene_type:complete